MRCPGSKPARFAANLFDKSPTANRLIVCIRTLHCRCGSASSVGLGTLVGEGKCHLRARSSKAKPLATGAEISEIKDRNGCAFSEHNRSGEAGDNRTYPHFAVKPGAADFESDGLKPEDDVAE